MRYAPGHKERTRSKILEAAGRVFRRQGYQGTGIDTVMEAAGLTSGGFYSHFSSKEALLAEVLGRSAEDGTARREAGAGPLPGRETAEGFVDFYLSLAHRNNPERGCTITPLISELGRSSDPIRGRFESVLGKLAAKLAGGEGEGPPPDRALAVAALCVGGLGLARSVKDEAFAGRVLAACRELAKDALRGLEDDHADGRAGGR